MKPVKDILLFPWMTEKTTNLRMHGNQYVFKVTSNANKVEIKQAVESRFSVRVKSVRTINVMGKVKRNRRFQPGRRPDWKKAVITLFQGDAIKEFEAA